MAQARRSGSAGAILSIMALAFLLSRANAFAVVKSSPRSMRTGIVIDNRFAFPSRSELLVLRLEAKKGSSSDVDTDQEEKADDGWGFDADDDVLEEARKELNSTPAAAERERDLFIPLFALVSIAGFAGLYGYEMLRLYFAGELYLPFLH